MNFYLISPNTPTAFLKVQSAIYLAESWRRKALNAMQNDDPLK